MSRGEVWRRGEGERRMGVGGWGRGGGGEKDRGRRLGEGRGGLHYPRAFPKYDSEMLFRCSLFFLHISIWWTSS